MPLPIKNIHQHKRAPGDENIHQLKQYGVDVYAHDPNVTDNKMNKYGPNMSNIKRFKS